MHHWIRLGAAQALLSLVVGCAEQAPPPRVAEPQQAPEQAVAAPAPIVLAPVVATKLSFSFAPSEGDEIGQRASDELAKGLAAAGFRFAPAGSGDPDARFEVRIASDDDTSRPKVSLLLARGDDVVEWATAIMTDESTLGDTLRPLVARMCGSSRVASFAESVVQDKERAAALSRTMPKLVPSIDAVAGNAMEPDLTDAALRRCRNARVLDACEPVRAYLRDHPNGARAPQAAAAWKLASERLQRTLSATAPAE